jgi:hypothetical protein
LQRGQDGTLAAGAQNKGYRPILFDPILFDVVVLAC